MSKCQDTDENTELSNISIIPVPCVRMDITWSRTCALSGSQECTCESVDIPCGTSDVKSTAPSEAKYLSTLNTHVLCGTEDIITSNTQAFCHAGGVNHQSTHVLTPKSTVPTSESAHALRGYSTPLLMMFLFLIGLFLSMLTGMWIPLLTTAKLLVYNSGAVAVSIALVAGYSAGAFLLLMSAGGDVILSP